MYKINTEYPINKTNTEKYKYVDGCREISGMGGTYEKACRDMACFGVEFLENNEQRYSHVLKKYKNGVSINRQDLVDEQFINELGDAIADILNESPTGAMVGACVNHAVQAWNIGWENYLAKMIQAQKDKESK
jgi:hypothetical protein